MPIVFVHGVTTRDHNREHVELWRQTERLLRRHIAPLLSRSPQHVDIISAYWGDIGVKLHWGSASLPPDPELPGWKNPLMQFGSGKDAEEYKAELSRRSLSLPGYGLGKLLIQARGQLNEQMLMFVGDISSYFHHREAIVQRVMEALAQARRSQERCGGEPLVVMSHSMGGQIVYDLVTHYLPLAPEAERVRIDFWAAASSQVGVFEEMKLFRASQPIHRLGFPVPFPDQCYLRIWWNVWDPNDVLSFSARSIIADVIDEPYDSGLGLHEAHEGILTMPSFYWMFADRLSKALAAKR